MITEDCVSFEAAKLLKEKGFNEPCTVSFFDKDSYREWIETAPRPLYVDSESAKPFTYQRPTLQMAMKWLREEKNCFIDIHNSNGDGYFYEFVDLRDRGHLFSNNCCRLLPTYEEACEAAIKYCLENLI